LRRRALVEVEFGIIDEYAGNPVAHSAKPRRGRTLADAVEP
jgi:hypothetical protein